MRVCHFTLVATAIILAAASANSAQDEISTAFDGEKRNLRSQNLLEWPERLEEYVEHHNHIREIFTRWCLEDKKPEEVMKAAETENEKKAAALFKRYKLLRSQHGRRLFVLECNV
ncbi:hypothetical protein PHYSODRAFT_331290 [Phytophthora sojae]|uniref:RxLR effector protein n=1 Tax=Phytophthora sojae (strain P6497) TaxID=1094619 RepID=G4ZJ51_PHYSP|nr:hypothetical protein PHYSODRAFT_331290 [Phytophthora sojae]EGZ17298.1 hypothetical protein PHYSODRAFT_331290 [Phytophthora sojae]|eukprot:XP_009526356.1 hypothetical protein PHYSODRAFT_331290 [Phytophthora sojae]